MVQILVSFSIIIHFVSLVESDVNNKTFTGGSVGKSTISVASKDYCSFCCMNYDVSPPTKVCQKDHTLCKYNKDKKGKHCTDYATVRIERLLNIEKYDILKYQNQFRNKVATGGEKRGSPGPQPKASNMRQLLWDNELEEMAQTWAVQCVNSHDTCRDSDRFPVGQIVIETANQFYFKKLVHDELFMKVEKYDSRKITKYEKRGASTDDYTQIVWANSSKIGCGHIIYGSTETTTKELFVCNYGPTGNVPGEPVYTTGEPCKNCPVGTECSKEYVGLCEDLTNTVKITTYGIYEEFVSEDFTEQEKAASASSQLVLNLPLILFLYSIFF